jgi:hypothetical protein
MRSGTLVTNSNSFTPEASQRLWDFVGVVARQTAVQIAVEANHDDNMWWPLSVTDWRLRMVVAGWSARVSYAMVDTYSRVVRRSNSIGFDELVGLSDSELLDVVGPIGLHRARITYTRSVAAYLSDYDDNERSLLALDSSRAIADFASRVKFAGYKIAQCATLYARGYHCGIVPVDSGMLAKLAPCLGWTFRRGALGHEEMRLLIEACIQDRTDEYRDLAKELGYQIHIPIASSPTWFVHLALIYFKRIYCNRPADRLCVRRPTCARVLDCDCAIWDD